MYAPFARHRYLLEKDSNPKGGKNLRKSFVDVKILVDLFRTVCVVKIQHLSLRRMRNFIRSCDKTASMHGKQNASNNREQRIYRPH